MSSGNMDLQNMQGKLPLMCCSRSTLTSGLEIHPQLHTIATDELPVTPVNAQYGNHRHPSATSTLSDPATVIRWDTPPSRAYTPRIEHTSPKYTTNDTTKQPQTPEQTTENDITTYTTTKQPHSPRIIQSPRNDIRNTIRQDKQVVPVNRQTTQESRWLCDLMKSKSEVTRLRLQSGTGWME